MRVLLWILLVLSGAISAALAETPFTITDAIHQAAQSNPGVGEAAANRRATEAELRQTQGTLLPQVRLEAKYGPEMLDHHVTSPGQRNGEWQIGREGSVIVRQLLFDGFSSINDIWRQAARVEGAAMRVLERTELIALDAAEAYIDVVRYLRLVQLAVDNVETHRRIQVNVKARYEGGRTGEGDLQQIQERVAAAEAVLADFRRILDEARAKYRRAVGLEPFNLRFPGRLGDMPKTKDESLAVALRHNPTLRAAEADVKAARHAFDATAGAFVPNLALEAKALHGVDTQSFPGKREEYSAKIVANWDIFTGGQKTWKRAEFSERMIEQTERHARLQRGALESLDKAWAARTITSERIAALTRQVESAKRVVEAYTKEYELGQRTLVDILDAENQLFNALVSLTSTRAVAVFADYQLLAAMGKLLEYLKAPVPLDADPLDRRPFGVYPTKLPPILLRAPNTGPQPLSVLPFMAAPEVTTRTLLGPKVVSRIDEIWPSYAQGDQKTPSNPTPSYSQDSQKTPGGPMPITPSGINPSADASSWPNTTLSFASEIGQLFPAPFRDGKY